MTIPSNSPLTPYLILIKSMRGQALTKCVLDAVNDENVFVFGELLDMDNVKQVTFYQHIFPNVQWIHYAHPIHIDLM
jgi:hypothetical protein